MHEATRQWVGQYPEEYRTEITDEYTLGELIERLERYKLQEFTVSDIARILNLTYQQAYNKVKPKLERAGFAFVRSKKKTR